MLLCQTWSPSTSNRGSLSFQVQVGHAPPLEIQHRPLVASWGQNTLYCIVFVFVINRKLVINLPPAAISTAQCIFAPRIRRLSFQDMKDSHHTPPLVLGSKESIHRRFKVVTRTIYQPLFAQNFVLVDGLRSVCEGPVTGVCILRICIMTSIHVINEAPNTTAISVSIIWHTAWRVMLMHVTIIWPWDRSVTTTMRSVTTTRCNHDNHFIILFAALTWHSTTWPRHSTSIWPIHWVVRRRMSWSWSWSWSLQAVQWWWRTFWDGHLFASNPVFTDSHCKPSVWCTMLPFCGYHLVF